MTWNHIFFQQQLAHVGQRLQQSPQPDAIGAVTILHPRREFLCLKQNAVRYEQSPRFTFNTMNMAKPGITYGRNGSGTYRPKFPAWFAQFLLLISPNSFYAGCSSPALASAVPSKTPNSPKSPTLNAARPGISPAISLRIAGALNIAVRSESSNRIRTSGRASQLRKPR